MAPRKKSVPVPQPWSDADIKSAKKIQLPDRIICYICKHYRPLDQYSKTQQIPLRSFAYNHGLGALQNQQVARCMHCSGTSRVELQCFKCHNYKSIDEFARNQRMSEKPVCQQCADYEEVQDWEQLPGTEPKDGNDENAVMSRGLIEDVSSQSNQSTALVLRGDRSLAASSSEFTDPNPRKFARVRAYKEPKEDRPYVPRPEIADLGGEFNSDINPADYL